MINLDKIINVFVITNGRSTFEYCKESIENQKEVKFNVITIRGVSWQEAHERILRECDSKFALRVDDDMLLHPYALKYIYQCIKDQDDKIALRGWRLWEPWSNKVCKGIKVYNMFVAKEIRFELDKRGKIDKLFTRNSEKKGYVIKYSKDIIAIHSCGNFKEHLSYWQMRGEAIDESFEKKRKWAEGLMNNFNMSLADQYKLTGNFMKKLNMDRHTDFGEFLNGQNII